MQRLSAWARWIGVTILIPILIPLAVHFIEQQPPETAGVVLKFFLSLAEQTWFRVSALLLIGLVAGLWLDWLLRKFDGSRAKARENLGYEMRNLAHDIDNALALADRFRLPDFSPRLMSAFIKARRFGLWAPDDEVINKGIDLGVLTRYLREVGTMLEDGHLKEAKRIAGRVRTGIEQWLLQQSLIRRSASRAR